MSKKTKTAYQTIGFRERNRRSQGYLLKKTVRNIVYKIARAALLFGMCFMILQPILNKISISFMAEEDLYNPMIIAIPELLQRKIKSGKTITYQCTYCDLQNSYCQRDHNRVYDLTAYTE